MVRLPSVLQVSVCETPTASAARPLCKGVLNPSHNQRLIRQLPAGSCYIAAREPDPRLRPVSTAVQNASFSSTNSPVAVATGSPCNTPPRRSRTAAAAQTLDRLHSGDTLVVWRLDRLALSLRDLIDVVTALDERGVGLRSLPSKPIPPARAAALSSTSSARWPSSSGTSSGSAPWLGLRCPGSGPQRRPAHRDDAGEDRPSP